MLTIVLFMAIDIWLVATIRIELINRLSSAEYHYVARKKGAYAPYELNNYGSSDFIGL